MTASTRCARRAGEDRNSSPLILIHHYRTEACLQLYGFINQAAVWSNIRLASHSDRESAMLLENGIKKEQFHLGVKMLGLIKHTHYSFSSFVKFGIKNMETKENQHLNGRATSIDNFKYILAGN